MVFEEFAAVSRDCLGHSAKTIIRSCRASGFVYWCSEAAVIVIFTFLFNFTKFFHSKN